MHAIERFRRSGALGQLVRFGIAGGIVSLIYAVVYLRLATYVFPARMAVAAVPPAFAVAVTCSFFAHSRWSFKDHGTRQAGIRQHMRFGTVQAVGLAINAVVTWIGTAQLHLPPWLPLAPAVILAALITFVLNRSWVFR